MVHSMTYATLEMRQALFILRSKQYYTAGTANDMFDGSVHLHFQSATEALKHFCNSTAIDMCVDTAADCWDNLCSDECTDLRMHEQTH